MEPSARSQESCYESRSPPEPAPSELGGGQRGWFSMESSALYIYAVTRVGSRCGGRTPSTLDGRSHEDRPAAAVKGLMVCGQPTTARANSRVKAQRSSISRRHAVAGLAARHLRAWCSSFFSWLPPSHANMDWLKHVYSKVGPSGVPPPVHERSHGNSSLAPAGHCLSGWEMAPKTLS